MNSLYKTYIKNTLLLLLISDVISFLYIRVYVIYRLYNNFDTALATNSFITIIGVFINIFILYYDRNKKTGIFIKSLPCNDTIGYVIKAICPIIYIILLTIFQMAIFYYYKKHMENNIIFEYVYKDLLELIFNYSKYYILLAAVLTLFAHLIGVIGFAIIAPIILFILYTITTIGILLYDFVEYGSIYDVYYQYINIKLLNLFLYKYSAIIVSAILIIISGILNKYMDYANIGKLFLFKWIKYPAVIITAILSSFGIYFIAISLYNGSSTEGSIIIFIIAFVVCCKIINSICNYFD